MAETEQRQQAAAGAGSAAGEEPILSIRHLSKRFGSLEVLKDISFDVRKGEVVVVLGPSGSGKSTMLRCLNRLEEPTSGEIIFEGDDICQKGVDVNDVRKRMGMVFQQFNLFPHYNAITNIKLAAELLGKEKSRRECAAIDAEAKAEKAAVRAAHKSQDAALKGENLPKDEFNAKKRALKASHRAELIELADKTAAKKTAVRERLFGDIDRRAQALLDRVGLGDRAEAYPCELSGGQQQRIAIARALALSPDILCFDEPTSALDPELTGEVLKVIKGLKSGDSTMIVVTHEMEFARGVADKVIFMADGVIEEMGSPYQIFEAPQSEKTKAFLQKSREQLTGDDF